jgi:hypothetical protein
MKLRLTAIGERPMLQHNGRLSDPLNAYTRRLKELTGKRRKTDEDLTDIMMVESRASAYESTDDPTKLGWPTANFWATIYNAAKAFKLGEDIKRGLSYEGGRVEPLEVDGEVPVIDQFLMDENHISYESVVVQRSRTMRARLFVPLQWRTVHTFELFEDVVDPHRLGPVFERAGRLVGFGDWRPQYGTFRAEVEYL